MQYVDQVFFIDVPFWGAPKAYYVYLQGDMLPVIADKLMRQLAPNTPIVYYLAPSEQYPFPVAITQTHFDETPPLVGEADTRVRRNVGQSVSSFMNALMDEARRSGGYPSKRNIDPWNIDLERDARLYHASVQGEPVIHWSNCYVFFSNSLNHDTPGPVYVVPGITRVKNFAYEKIEGDGTVPLASQRADFPDKCLIEIPTHPEHVPAPNEPFVWKTIIQKLAESAVPASDGK